MRRPAQYLLRSRRPSATPGGVRRPLLALGLAAWAAVARAQQFALPAAPVPYTIGGQITDVWQYKPSFTSPYEGPNSLRGSTENALSHSYTLYTGVRPFSWIGLYAAPEMIRGEGISDGRGLAGYTNGEVIRNPAAGKAPYLGRAFARATIPLGPGMEDAPADLLDVGGPRPTHRLVVTGGILSAGDIFDTNRYANNTRTAFLNWTFINDTAWDFAADTRGYTRGFAVEWIAPQFALRGGTFQMPTVANGLDLDSDLLHANGSQIEVEVDPVLLPGRPLTVRTLAYWNLGRMGNYRDAIAQGQQLGETPDITRTRGPTRTKYGFALNVQQPLSEDGATGLFARGGWSDGRNETFCYTEADWTVSLGAQVGGAPWRRTDDRFAVAAGVNGLSDAHADYLAAGGLGFQLGDGRLSYRPETILETYYLFQPVSWAALTVDYQFIADPGDNRARGPVSVVSVRLHLQALGRGAAGAG